jgi:Ca2+/Na+ antiporter
MRWAVPVVLGLVYGYWAAANRRGGGEITGWNLLFGFVTALVFMVLYVAVRALASRMMREVHALLWLAFAGISFGFLYSQTDKTVLRSTVMGLVIGAVFFVVLFYRYYTHEDAEGHRTD